jgi:hypothetical protein
MGGLVPGRNDSRAFRRVRDARIRCGWNRIRWVKTRFCHPVRLESGTWHARLKSHDSSLRLRTRSRTGTRASGPDHRPRSAGTGTRDIASGSCSGSGVLPDRPRDRSRSRRNPAARVLPAMRAHSVAGAIVFPAAPGRPEDLVRPPAGSHDGPLPPSCRGSLRGHGADLVGPFGRRSPPCRRCSHLQSGDPVFRPSGGWFFRMVPGHLPGVRPGRFRWSNGLAGCGGELPSHHSRGSR